MNFGRIGLKTTNIECPRQRTKPVFKLKREFDGSHPYYMKYGRNLVKNNKLE